MILDDLRQYLRSRPEITVLTGKRIRPSRLSQGDANAASIRFVSISRRAIQNLEGPCGIVERRIQVDCYSPDYAEVQILAEHVRLAMYGFPGNYGDDYVTTVTPDNASDSTEKIDDGGDAVRERVRQDWLIWHTEAVPA